MGIQRHVLLVLCMVIAEAMITSSALRLPDRKYGMNLIDRNSQSLSTTHGIESLNRSSFPTGFVFGAASSSYQVEGGTNESTGRGASIWDTFAHTYPEKITDGSNGDIAVDSYNRYKEDVALIKESNLDAYRFSFSWSRILPTGKVSGGVNARGIKYYSDLIDELHSKGIEPYVTLFHWDYPQALHDEYGGFINSKSVADFVDYADLCFKTFGARVKHWTTFNEPWTYTVYGYDTGTFAPGRCSAWQQVNCSGGDSGTEPYLVTHHQLLSHAATVKLYKSKYQASQQGKIGIVLVSYWMLPYSNSTLDEHAATRGLDFMIGWFLDPLINGDYPLTMRTLVKERLPKFTEEESKMIKGSYDYIGTNYYTARYAIHSNEVVVHPSYSTDSRVNLTAERDGILIGEPAGSDWFFVYPRGIGDLLLYIKRKYNNPPLVIMENGIDEINNSTLSLKEALADSFRIKYYYSHLYHVHNAIKNGSNLLGYFAWSILDNFEWSSGYTVRFGINFVDYDNGLKRYRKLSSDWFTNFLKK